MTLYWLMGCLSTISGGDPADTSATRIFSMLVYAFSIYMNVYILSTGLAPALKRGVLEERMQTKKAKLAGVLDFYKVPLFSQAHGRASTAQA